jgi:hypothetical protein
VQLGRSYWWALGLPVLLEADARGIALRVFWKRYYFDKTTISAVRLCVLNPYFLPFLRGVQILHTRSGYPAHVIIQTCRPASLVSELEELGFHRQDEFTWDHWAQDGQ